MSEESSAGLHAGASIDRARPEEVVMGVHWAPAGGSQPARPHDLDALCLLLDVGGCVLEAIHPGRTRSADGSVIHTGDSRNGASHWDDERIFVFLGALPHAVAKVAFVVSSATGASFDTIAGARCHVSDRISDRPWIRVDLTQLHGQTAHTVASLIRAGDAWRLAAGDAAESDALRAALTALSRLPK